MSNLAVIFTGKNQVEVQPIEMPGKPDVGLVMIETSKSLISAGTECIALQRKFSPGTHWDNWVKYPFKPGYCGVGRIVEAAADAADFKVGDRVSIWSGHQRFGVERALRAVRVPEQLSDEEAAWGPMAQIAQHGFRKANVQIGETVVVVGLGMLGQLIVQYARLAGAGAVIAIDPAAPRLKLAQKHGATHALGVDVEQALEAVKQITAGHLSDVLFDMTGNAKVFQHSQSLLGDNGRLAVIGDTGSPEDQRLTSDFIQKNLHLVGAHQRGAIGAPWHHQRMGELFFTYLVRGQMNVKDLISHRFPVNQAAEAYKLLTTRRDEAMGVILNFT